METAGLRAGTEAGLGLSSVLRSEELRKRRASSGCQKPSRFPGEEAAPGLPVPHLKTGPMPLWVSWGLDECERVPDPGVLGGSGQGEASCLCSCNTRARPLCNPLRPQPCAFARRTVPRDTASPSPGPPASLQPQQLLPTRHLKTLGSTCSLSCTAFSAPPQLAAVMGTSPEGPLNHQLATTASPAGRRVVPTSNRILQDEGTPATLRHQIRGRHSHFGKRAFSLSHRF